MTLDDYGDAPSSNPDKAKLTGHDVAAELINDWRLMLGMLRARFTTADFASALALVDAIGAAAEAADHHPVLALAWGRVDVQLFSHDIKAITQRDIRLARQISEIAGGLGASAAPPSELTVVELALDSPDHEAIRPFWAAVLGLDLEGSRPDEVVDSTGTVPSLWFQKSEVSDPDHEMRFHLDVWVALDQADDRIQAALDAGGTLISEGHKPSFTVLADAQGNKACICTWIGH